jgi:hypothetical protein
MLVDVALTVDIESAEHIIQEQEIIASIQRTCQRDLLLLISTYTPSATANTRTPRTQR